MKNISILLWIVLATSTLLAQGNEVEREKIRSAVNEYIEGRNNGEVERLRNAFLPNATLKGISRSKEQTVTTIDEYIAKQTSGRKHNCTTEVRFIDFVNDVAIAQVVLSYTTHTYYDYLILMKVQDHWVISDKVYTRLEPSTIPAK